MSIKLRLVLSYIAMLIIPLIIFFVAISVITNLYFNKVKKNYNFQTYSTAFIKNPFEEIRNINDIIFDKIKYNSIKNPQVFENRKYLVDLNSNLKKYNSYLVVRKNNDIIYLGNEDDKNTIYNNLSGFNAYEEEKIRKLVMGNKPLIIRQQDFYFNNKSQGSVFLITDVSIFFDTIKKIVITIAIVIILILIATNGLLTYMISRSIIVPLKELKKGANKIKQGNLDFKMEPYSKDEIGELCITFEDMRVKLKESVDRQTQYENNRKELISNISHDLKTPITSIKGYVEGIMDGVADTPEKMDKYIKTIYNKASSMDLLIDELFLYSKLDLNKVPFNFEKVDIIAYLQDCIEEMQFDLEKKNVKIKFTYKLIDQVRTTESKKFSAKTKNETPTSKDRELFVIADRKKLRRAIINIIGNSIKYMDKEQGNINVILTYKNESPRIEIRDNGKGISEEALPFIFDRFYRGDLSRNSSNGGSGLGLAIVKKIVQEHGGIIWANSEKSKGTSIFFTLRRFENREENTN